MTKLHRLIIVAHCWKENQLSRQSGLAAFGAWRFGEIPTIWLLSPESSKQTKMCCKRCMAACTVHINCHSCILDLFVILVRNRVQQVVPERKLFWVYRTKTFPFVCLCHVNFTFESPDGRCNHGSNSQKCWKSNQSFCFSWSSAECGEPISSWQQKLFSLFFLSSLSFLIITSYIKSTLFRKLKTQHKINEW